MTLPDVTFLGARVLTPDGLADTPLALSRGLIAEAPAGVSVDASGHLILPGIVDIHGDGFERHLAPRRGALESLSAGLASLDAELAANGITTAVLAQFFSWEGGMRGPDFAERLADALAGTPMRADTMLQLRLETGMIGDFDRALALIGRARIPYVVLNDHLPHRELAEGRRPPRLSGQALKAQRSPEAHWKLLQEMHDRRDEVPAALAHFCAVARQHGVLIGSHDDHTAEDRARARALGATLSEFPETAEAAMAARKAGEGVIMGAPNLVRGGSHAGKVAAGDLVAEGIVDALASDYHYPAPARAAFRLAADGMDLARAWALVSSGPARLLGLSDRGRIVPGLRADLVIVEEEGHRIAATVAGGEVSFLAGPLATRFLQAAT
ncbi:alpha-D-ribose 1-methylphosphonate 5-triphosphate diphosphatase [Roseibacterium sp. SDUM158017]|uniref:alpha-D-ribose 1-methylphosphonate 5-triphosphate diphosphatase n=1 Tax=Roseicyclus salinarum TaxID=3036773 RepID=UPI0024151314|nr:alpha-D-ribose 1-methylphosphonate 5-triphosphate diphosphatase [Roseibacterium sp. SDUM158017]MDG4648313.1 alpha-D-ribose 1-methylphosphonate 5-triphosphate diphosphatase [Roseibacterium sp. SDUM158017]